MWPCAFGEGEYKEHVSAESVLYSVILSMSGILECASSMHCMFLAPRERMCTVCVSNTLMCLHKLSAYSLSRGTICRDNVCLYVCMWESMCV